MKKLNINWPGIFAIVMALTIVQSAANAEREEKLQQDIDALLNEPALVLVTESPVGEMYNSDILSTTTETEPEDTFHR